MSLRYIFIYFILSTFSPSELIKKYKKKSEDYEKFQSQVRVLTKQLHSMHGSMLGLQKEMDCIFKVKVTYIPQ